MKGLKTDSFPITHLIISHHSSHRNTERPLIVSRNSLHHHKATHISYWNTSFNGTAHKTQQNFQESRKTPEKKRHAKISCGNLYTSLVYFYICSMLLDVSLVNKFKICLAQRQPKHIFARIFDGADMLSHFEVSKSIFFCNKNVFVIM